MLGRRRLGVASQPPRAAALRRAMHASSAAALSALGCNPAASRAEPASPLAGAVRSDARLPRFLHSNRLSPDGAGPCSRPSGSAQAAVLTCSEATDAHTARKRTLMQMSSWITHSCWLFVCWTPALPTRARAIACGDQRCHAGANVSHAVAAQQSIVNAPGVWYALELPRARYNRVFER